VLTVLNAKQPKLEKPGINNKKLQGFAVNFEYFKAILEKSRTIMSRININT